MTTDETPHIRGRRERSTRYPGVPLADCVELAKFIESRGLDGVKSADIATSLGYKNIKTNTFSARLSAARQFGLLNLVNEGYSLTPLAKSILHPLDLDDLPKFYRQALLQPPIYAELIERLADKKVPEIGILGNILYHNHHIIATAKEAAAEAFVASAKFAGTLGDDMILRPHPVATIPAPPPPKPDSAKKEAPISRPASKSSSDVRIDLRLWGADSGKLLRVRAPESITIESYERLLAALKLHVRIES
jgi:hypothetical protein